MSHKIQPLHRTLRFLHGSRIHSASQRTLLPPPAPHTRRIPRVTSSKENTEEISAPKREIKVIKAKRNELGVQLLSRKLHEQIFRNVSFPPPDKTFVAIAKEHLNMHGLDPAQGSVLPDIGFTLPSLQGRTLDEHFYRIGAEVSQPWLNYAKELSTAQLPPKPEHWHIQTGWTKYHYESDGSGYSTAVDFPQLEDGTPEEMLVFDVETMPEYSPYAVMACAASKNAWYSWISPWLLGQSEDTQHLVPLGNSAVPKIVVGHNVSYDRARIMEEYNLQGTQTRFLDTMSLHVAVKGISSHQRPAWMKYRKAKLQAKEQKDEAVDAVLEMMRESDELVAGELDDVKKEELRKLRAELEDSLPQLQADNSEEAEAELSSKRWEDLTSANSLADVAKLHCGIVMDKEARSDFMTSTREDIVEGIQDYLSYCANDVFVTHAVFSTALPAFLAACPNPVSFAGILTMGSSFLTVNQEWEKYIANAERTYRDLEDKIKSRLLDLVQEAKGMMDSGSWKQDTWLSQLDWSPKVAGKSRGIGSPAEIARTSETKSSRPSATKIPAWYKEFLVAGPFGSRTVNLILPLLLKLSYSGYPMIYSASEKWHYVVDGTLMRLPTAGKSKTLTLLSGSHGLPAFKKEILKATDTDLAVAVSSGETSQEIADKIIALAKTASQLNSDSEEVWKDAWLSQLDWKLVTPPDVSADPVPKAKRQPKAEKPPPVLWPKWFWELAKPKKDMAPGTVDITVKSRLAPLLLRLSWQGWPLFYSREHGWTYRVPTNVNYKSRTSAVAFKEAADESLKESVVKGEYVYYKLPHKDGEKANVGSPLGKTFMKYAQDGTLTSPGGEAKDALDMNAQCSYWISARDRVMKQMVVWEDAKLKMGFGQSGDSEEKWGVIIPQIITMGTVTRRAIEKTWLTASNAKKNRVGSELKAMVRAPEGYAIVGADVDSEELWISSVMGDAQFGLHGATAIGWMTLEGTKSAGTDLHSKTASILGISRDQAKVFNYSRIYGAGMKHAVLLLLQSNAGMLAEEAQKLAGNLYASTKGKNTHRQDIFNRKFWFGGTESFVFNKLEQIATSDCPQTPALGCGVTYALSKEYLPEEFGSDYMPSRINWVVQSSGVDYLHLLIVSMDYLIQKYNINARFLISVHDELRYLVKEEDRYRAALALQIANLWTRSLFSFKLGMDDLPQGVAFFSAVDIDKVLRKEVDMPCVTPSQPVPIPPGESLDIAKVLDKTNGGSLWADGRSMVEEVNDSHLTAIDGYKQPECLVHRADSAAWLRAQATSDFAEIKHLAQKVTGKKYVGGIGGRQRSKRKIRPVDYEAQVVDADLEAAVLQEIGL
ncbi:DNA polymerase type-A family protein [Abortiporus biennis]